MIPVAKNDFINFRTHFLKILYQNILRFFFTKYKFPGNILMWLAISENIISEHKLETQQTS
jgi:hypothetical protein